jgi:hypothetical protein
VASSWWKVWEPRIRTRCRAGWCRRGGLVGPGALALARLLLVEVVPQWAQSV